MPNTTHVHQPHQVYIRQRWSSAWTTVPGLYCDWFKEACSPDVNEAQFTRNFGGQIVTAGSQVLTTRSPLDINGWYVRVVLSQDNGLFVQVKQWVGVIVSTQQDRTGIQNLDDEIGSQVFYARGLDYLLQRQIVDSSFVQVGEDGEKEIGRAIGFNMGPGRGNESFRWGNVGATGEKGSKIFAETLEDQADDTAWNGAEIVNYLLKYHAPVDEDGVVKVPLQFDAGQSTEILETFEPALAAEGKSVKQLLDELIDRRRAMTWAVVAEPLGGGLLNPSIVVFTFNSDPLNLPSGKVVPANPNQTTWYNDDEGRMLQFLIVDDDATKFDQVVARGEPLGSCFTLNYQDGNLEPDWDTPQQTAYNDGASNDSGYSALTDEEKRDANQQVRNGPDLIKVYRYFRVPPDWDGLQDTEIVCPKPTEDEEAEPESVEFWMPGLRFQSRLPLLTETSYAIVETITADTLEGSRAEYLRPFGVIYDSQTLRNYPLDSISSGGDMALFPEEGGRHWGASLRMQEEQLGVIIDVHGQGMQHKIADDEFVAADAVDETDYETDLRWQDIYCTVFAEFDQHAEYRYPETVAGPTDQVRELVITVPNARLDYLCPGTVVGLDTEGGQITSLGGYIRDDRELLKDVARASWQWYGQTRRAIEATIHTLISPVSLGDLITNTGALSASVEVNTVVTSQLYNVREGTVTIRTSFAQLDFTAF